LFVHVVEEGLAESDDAVALARHYLAGVPEVDTMILGCTHYPLLSSVIQRVLGPAVVLVSSADVTRPRR
jgi:glutamate racemase